MILSTLLDSGPDYIRKVFVFQIPVVMPLVGMQVASVYLLTFGLIAITSLCLAVFFGRMLLPLREITFAGEKEL